MEHLKHQNYKNEDIKTKYLKNMLENRNLSFKELGAIIKTREIKLRNEVEELFFKTIISATKNAKTV